MSDQETRIPVVAIGASAGGIRALEGFFSALPANPGAAFVIITHLNPERESILHEIIARFTKLSVVVAADGKAVKPNCVYVMPADSVLTILEAKLVLNKLEPHQRERKPVDIFFAALAKDSGEYAVGIVLSGGDGDGTLGVKAIKERGGLTLAQVADGSGPDQPDMPNSAIQSGYVDLALPVEAMGPKVVEFVRKLAEEKENTIEHVEAGQTGVLNEAGDEIYDLLRNQVGHDFSGYKKPTFLRRVKRRAHLLGMGSLEAYVDRLRQDPKEVVALFRDLLISVTGFFRDVEAFEALRELVIPKLFEQRGANDTVRVWVPGCATGEEVYSLAILIREHMDTLQNVPQVQIFATDIDEHALSIARLARYPESLLEGISRDRRSRFFKADGASFVVVKDVRDLCIFSVHSVVRDPPFSRMDLLSCRNLLIYLDANTQSEVIPIFHYALRSGGYLFLGKSENVSQFTGLFSPIEKTQRIFRCRADSSALANLSMVVGKARPKTLTPDIGAAKAISAGVALRQLVEVQVLEQFAPPHVVTNRDGDVVYFSARTGKYLEASPGTPSRQLLSLARKGLRLDLRTALNNAVVNSHSAVREKVPVEGDDGRTQLVTIIVTPLDNLGGTEPLYLVLFNDDGPSLSEENVRLGAGTGKLEETLHLERELRDTRERLQSLIEEYETALEEQKATNEELVSVNEEMQSTNEEMEASKEEMQSLNEELQTVNTELHFKVDALDHAHQEIAHLLSSSPTATLFLGRDLDIKFFTPAVGKIFNILPSDTGRPLTHLTSRIPLPTLIDDVGTVISTGREIERQITVAENNSTFLMRISPYQTPKQEDGAVVVTFADVSSVTLAEAHNRVLIAELNHRVKNMLGVVVAIGEQTLRTSPSLDAFKTTFVARLHAMARSHELLSRENWTAASMEELVRQELSPFGMERIAAQGPNVRLKPEQALSVGMILHELATNAGKYGALSAPSGRVSVSWTREIVDGVEKTTVEWNELGGPAVTPPQRKGFGLKLVEKEAKYRLGGDAEIAFRPQGLTARWEIKHQSGDEAASG